MRHKGRIPASHEVTTRELQAIILEDPVTVFHALYCPDCGRDPLALPTLALVGWDAMSFADAVEREHGAGA